MRISRRTLLEKLVAGSVIAAGWQTLTDHLLANESPDSHEGSVSPVLRLSGNENPYGPSERVLLAMHQALSRGNRYSIEESELLCSRLAAFHSIAPEQVILGCGSSEILTMAGSALLERGRKLIQASPTCSVLARFAQNIGMEVVSVPLTKSYDHDLDAMAQHAKTQDLVYICNPNNPTGTLTARRTLEAFINHLPAKTNVIIDEAYHEFLGENARQTSFLNRPADDSRVIVVRTFSKIYGLAGMRIGYAVASRDVAHRLSQHRFHLGMNVLSARAASVALADSEYIRLSVKRNTDDRQEFLNQANARMLRTLDSHANFVMLNCARPAADVLAHLRKNSIVVAPPYPEMSKYLRVSLGTRDEMRQFWRVWDTMHDHKMAM